MKSVKLARKICSVTFICSKLSTKDVIKLYWAHKLHKRACKSPQVMRHYCNSPIVRSIIQMILADVTSLQLKSETLIHHYGVRANHRSHQSYVFAPILAPLALFPVFGLNQKSTRVLKPENFRDTAFLCEGKSESQI